MHRIFFLICIAYLGILPGCMQQQEESQPRVVQEKPVPVVEKKKEKRLPQVPKKQEIKETSLVAAGDIMLSRWVGVKQRASGDNTHAFRNVANIFRNADIAFANLESPFNNKGPFITEGMVFKAEPEYIEGLVFSGFDVLSLANNHFGNQQRFGMEYTFNHLEENNIGYCGAGKNSASAHEPYVISRNEISFAFLCYNGIAPKSTEATEDAAGHAWARPEEVTVDVARAKKKADVVIVSMHHGVEYTIKPNLEQIEFAHAAIDAGAETVIGHHPHVVQEVEKYKDKLIVYSLGNLIFDQMWSTETREGVIGQYFSKDTHLEKIDFQPIVIEDYNQPRFATEEESKKILNRMGLEKSLFQ